MKILLSCLFVLFLLFITTSGVPVTASPTKEEGQARIVRVICTDTGLCLIFYYREAFPSDYGIRSGPYVKTAYLTPSGEFTKLSAAFDLYMNNAEIMHYLFVFEVQEDDNFLRLIGTDFAYLCEIWWCKNNNSIKVREKDLRDLLGKNFHHHIALESLLQWRYVNRIKNYSLIGLETPIREHPNDFYQLVKIDFDTVEKIPIPISLVELKNAWRFLFDGNDSLFFANYPGVSGTGRSDQLLIQRLFLNGTLQDYLTLDRLPIGHDFFPYTDVKGNPFLGIFCRDPKWQDFSREVYNHTFYLINLVNNHTFSHSFTSQENSPSWDVLSDAIGNFHIVLNAEKITEYLKFSPNGTLLHQSTLAFPESGKFHIPDDSCSLYQTKYVLGGLYRKNKDAGLFVVNTDTGETVSVDTSLIPYIDYPKDFFGIEGLVILPSIATLALIRNKLSNRKYNIK